MLWDVLQVVILTVTFMYVFLKAPTARVRRMALLPLFAVLMEMLGAGLTDALALWPLTLVLTAARLALVVCCIGAVHQERRRVRQQRRKTAKVVPLPSAAGCGLQRPCA